MGQGRHQNSSRCFRFGLRPRTPVRGAGELEGVQWNTEVTNNREEAAPIHRAGAEGEGTREPSANRNAAGKGLCGFPSLIMVFSSSGPLPAPPPPATAGQKEMGRADSQPKTQNGGSEAQRKMEGNHKMPPTDLKLLQVEYLRRCYHILLKVTFPRFSFNKNVCMLKTVLHNTWLWKDISLFTYIYMFKPF